MGLKNVGENVEASESEAVAADRESVAETGIGPTNEGVEPLDPCDDSDARADDWWVYLMQCADESLYCGISKNPVRREHEHNTSPRGAKYTHSHRPVRLVYWEGPLSKSDALKREIKIKALRRSRKELLVERFLSSTLLGLQESDLP